MLLSVAILSPDTVDQEAFLRSISPQAHQPEEDVLLVTKNYELNSGEMLEIRVWTYQVHILKEHDALKKLDGYIYIWDASKPNQLAKLQDWIGVVSLYATKQAMANSCIVSINLPSAGAEITESIIKSLALQHKLAYLDNRLKNFKDDIFQCFIKDKKILKSNYFSHWFSWLPSANLSGQPKIETASPKSSGWCDCLRFLWKEEDEQERHQKKY